MYILTTKVNIYKVVKVCSLVNVDNLQSNDWQNRKKNYYKNKSTNIIFIISKWQDGHGLFTLT